jgi:TRAP transporter TAXI family solute receptor
MLLLIPRFGAFGCGSGFGFSLRWAVAASGDFEVGRISRSSTFSRRAVLAAGGTFALLGGVGGTSLRAQTVPAAPPPAGPGFIRIAAGPFDSIAYAVAGTLGNLLSAPPGGRSCERGGSCGVPGLIAVAQAAADAAEALALVADGEAEAAVVSALALTDGKAATVRALASLYSRDLHVLVRQDADFVQNLSDLKGRRLGIAIGIDADVQVPRGVIAAARLLPPGGRAQLYPLRFGLAALVEGEVDALFCMVTPPSALLTETARQYPLSLVPVTAADVPPALADRAIPHELPGAVYPGVAASRVLAVPRLLVVAENLPADFVYDLASALWHPQTMRQLAAAGIPYSDIRWETALQGISRPLHPGAARFYREKNLTVPD